MRKISILISISLFLFTGCVFFEKKEDVPVPSPQESQLEKKIGVVNTPDELSILSAPAPFVLLTEAGDQIFINSLTVNMRRYKRRRVEAEGRFDSAKTVFQVENIVSLGQETQVKTVYQNPELGIKFQYPSIWVLKEEKNVLGSQKIVITPYEVETIELSTVDNIVIERSENNRKLSARKWLSLDEQYRATDPLDTKNVYQQSFVGVAQLDSVKKTAGAGEQVSFYVGRDTYMYSFAHETMNDADKDLYKNAFFDLVMSFEFIPFGPPLQLGTATAPIAQNQEPQKKIETKKSLAELAAEQQTQRLQEQQKAEELRKREETQRQQEEEAKRQQESAQSVKQSFIDYIKANIEKLAPEAAAEGKAWAVRSVEFAFPEDKLDEFTAIYVVYGDGQDSRKILLAVSDRSSPENLTRIAYFKPGVTTDWSLVEGADTAKNSDKSVVRISGDGQEIVVKKGMSLLDARSFKIKIQYPSSWYWAFIDGGYAFSNKPVASDNILIKLTKDTIAADMPSIDDLGGKPALAGAHGDAYSICVQGKSKYCVTAQLLDSASQQTMKEMLATLQEE